jgi:hypothetical protein
MGTLIVLLPIVLGAVVAFAKLDFAVRWVERVSAWVNRIRARTLEQNQGVSRRLKLAAIAGTYYLFKWSERIADPYAKSGLRLTAGIYVAFLTVGLFIYALVAMLMLALAVLILYFILDNALGGGSTTTYTVRSSGSRVRKHYDNSGQQQGQSETRDGLLGDVVTDHVDKAGNPQGTSHSREGFLGGVVTDHYDKSGAAAGHSESRDGLLGNTVTDDYDKSGQKVGHSETREGFFGDTITDHYDNSGKQTGHTE